MVTSARVSVGSTRSPRFNGGGSSVRRPTRSARLVERKVSATKGSRGVSIAFDNPLERGVAKQKKDSTTEPPKLLTRVQELRLLSKLEEAGLRVAYVYVRAVSAESGFYVRLTRWLAKCAFVVFRRRCGARADFCSVRKKSQGYVVLILGCSGQRAYKENGISSALLHRIQANICLATRGAEVANYTLSCPHDARVPLTMFMRRLP